MIMKILESQNRSILLATPSIFLFLLCLPFDAYCSNGECGQSWIILLVGWGGIFGSVTNALWLCNLFMLLTWINIYKGEKNKSLIFGSLSLLSVIFLFYSSHIHDASGMMREVTRIELGYYLWLASAVAAFIGSLFVRPAAPHLEEVDA
jgi:hypothetical protein